MPISGTITTATPGATVLTIGDASHLAGAARLTQFSLTTFATIAELVGDSTVTAGLAAGTVVRILEHGGFQVKVVTAAPIHHTSAAGTTFRVDAPFFGRPEFYGAAADNITSDAAAFQKADAAQVAGTCGPIYLAPGKTYYCPAATYKPTGLYFGQGYVRFGNETPFTDADTYQASNAPAPIYGPLHNNDRRGRNVYLGGRVFAGIAPADDNFNTGVGDGAGEELTAATRTTFVGGWAGRFADEANYCEAFGASAGQYLFGNRVTLLGNNAGKWLGSRDPAAQLHDFWDVGVQDDPTDDDPEVWGNKGFETLLPNVRALYLDGTVATVYENPGTPVGDEIVTFGNVKSSLLASTTDQVAGIVAIGRDSAIHALKALSVTAVGYKSAAQGLELTRVTALGRSAGEKALWHTDGVFVGNNTAIRAIVTNQTVVVGSKALESAYSVEDSALVGFKAGNAAGVAVLANNTTFNVIKATVMGSQAAATATTLVNCIALGYRAADTAADLTNKLFIGSGQSSVTTPTIGGDIDNRQVTINRPISSTSNAKLHVNQGTSSGVNANSAASIAVFEADAAGGITILTPNNVNGNLAFGDPDDSNVGRIQYAHSGDTMTFATGNGNRAVISATGLAVTGVITSTGAMTASGLLTAGASLSVTGTITASGAVTASGLLTASAGVAATGTVTATTGYGNGTVTWTTGNGTPEGVVTANVGALFSRLDGGATTTLYVKTSGTGNTGWTAK